MWLDARGWGFGTQRQWKEAARRPTGYLGPELGRTGCLAETLMTCRMVPEERLARYDWELVLGQMALRPFVGFARICKTRKPPDPTADRPEVAQ